MGKGGHFGQSREFAVEGIHVPFSEGIAIGPGVQFDDLGTNPVGSLNLALVGSDGRRGSLRRARAM